MKTKLKKITGVLQLLAGILAGVAMVQNILRGGERRIIVIALVVMIAGLYLGYENVTDKN